jgi:hypothetical protein
MRTENPFELSADAFDGGARSLVARVRMQADPKHLPTFKSMRQHQQLGLGVSCRPDGRARQPRIADLTSVGGIPPVPRMARRPSPSFHVEKPRRPDDDTVLYPDGSKRHRRAGISPSESGVDVADGFGLVPRNGTPLIKRAIARRSSNQLVNMAVVKRFETNVPAREHKTFYSHGSQYAMSCHAAASDSWLTSNAPPPPSASDRLTSRRAPSSPSQAWRI